MRLRDKGLRTLPKRRRACTRIRARVRNPIRGLLREPDSDRTPRPGIAERNRPDRQNDTPTQTLLRHEREPRAVPAHLSQTRPAGDRRRHGGPHRAALQRTDLRPGLRPRRMAPDLPAGRRERPVRPDRRILLPVALRDEPLGRQVPQTLGLSHPGGADGAVPLRQLLPHDLRRIRQRRAGHRLRPDGLLGRGLRPAALLQGVPTPLDRRVVRRAARLLRGRHRLQRRE